MLTLYTPPIATVALLMTGFCKVELKLFGPVQIKLPGWPAAELRLMVCPGQ